MQIIPVQLIFILVFTTMMVACGTAEPIPTPSMPTTTDDQAPTAIPTQTFVSHQFHIVLNVPAEWQIVRSLRSNNLLTIDSEDFAIEEVYQGEKGMLVISALTKDSSVDEICESVAQESNNRFGSATMIRAITVQDQPGCIIQPSDDQPADFYGEWAAVVSYPEPAVLGLLFDTYYHVLIIAKEAHIESLAESISFEVTSQDYLASTLDIIEHTGMSFNDDLNWEEVRAEAFSLAEDAETIADTHPAIKHAFGALQTGHTFFFTSAQVAASQSISVDGSQAVSGKRLENGIGYLALQDIGGNLETLKDYANTLHQIIQDIDEESTCGWVVSLRGNGGGSVFPMVAGLSPIIGEGEIGGFLLADGRQKILSLQDGFVLVDGVVIPEFGELLDEPLYVLKQTMPPVAVLVDQQTASAAEITALAFIGRPNSRLFGKSTGGYTTGNEVFPLFDGAMLILTFAKELDRTGKVYSESIIPDELVPSEDVMDTALEWLLAQPACASDQSE